MWQSRGLFVTLICYINNVPLNSPLSFTIKSIKYYFTKKNKHKFWVCSKIWDTFYNGKTFVSFQWKGIL